MHPSGPSTPPRYLYFLSCLLRVAAYMWHVTCNMQHAACGRSAAGPPRYLCLSACCESHVARRIAQDERTTGVAARAEIGNDGHL